MVTHVTQGWNSLLQGLLLMIEKLITLDLNGEIWNLCSTAESWYKLAMYPQRANFDIHHPCV